MENTVKVVNDDGCAHAQTKIMMVSDDTTAETLFQKFMKQSSSLSPLLPHYFLFHISSLLSPDTLIKPLLSPASLTAIHCSLLPTAPLHIVVSVQSRDAISRLKIAKATLKTYVDQDGRNLFHSMAYSSAVTPDAEIFKYLLRKKVSLTQYDRTGNTPITAALENGRFNLVTLFLRHATQAFKSLDRMDRTPLHCFCTASDRLSESERVEMAKKLLEICSPYLRDIKGNLPLHYAAMCGDVIIVSLLLDDYHLEVDVRNCFFQTPLFLATLHNRRTVVSYLSLLKGANRLLMDNEGRLPLDLVIGSEERSDLEKFVNISVSREILVASQTRKLEEFKAKIAGFFSTDPASQPSLSSPSPSPRSLPPSFLSRSSLLSNLYHVCAIRCKADFFIHLIQTYGARSVPTDFEGQSLSSLLLYNFSSEKSALSLLNWAIKRNRSGDRFYRLKKNRTLVHLAILLGLEIPMRLLISQGSVVNQCDDDGSTELHMVVHNANVRMASDLLSAGCDLSMRNNMGKNPLEHAEFYQKKEFLTLFRSFIGLPNKVNYGYEETIHPLPNIVDISVPIAEFILNAENSSAPVRAYYVVTHKMGSKQKIFRSPEGDCYSIFDFCEDTLNRKRSKGTFDLPMYVLDLCRKGDLQMLKHLVTHYGVDTSQPFCPREGSIIKSIPTKKLKALVAAVPPSAFSPNDLSLVPAHSSPPLFSSPILSDKIYASRSLSREIGPESIDAKKENGARIDAQRGVPLIRRDAPFILDSDTSSNESGSIIRSPKRERAASPMMIRRKKGSSHKGSDVIFKALDGTKNKSIEAPVRKRSREAGMSTFVIVGGEEGDLEIESCDASAPVTSSFDNHVGDDGTKNGCEGEISRKRSRFVTPNRSRMDPSVFDPAIRSGASQISVRPVSPNVRVVTPRQPLCISPRLSRPSAPGLSIASLPPQSSSLPPSSPSPSHPLNLSPLPSSPRDPAPSMMHVPLFSESKESQHLNISTFDPSVPSSGCDAKVEVVPPFFAGNVASPRTPLRFHDRKGYPASHQISTPVLSDSQKDSSVTDQNQSALRNLRVLNMNVRDSNPPVDTPSSPRFRLDMANTLHPSENDKGVFASSSSETEAHTPRSIDPAKFLRDSNPVPKLAPLNPPLGKETPRYTKGDTPLSVARQNRQVHIVGYLRNLDQKKKEEKAEEERSRDERESGGERKRGETESRQIREEREREEREREEREREERAEATMEDDDVLYFAMNSLFFSPHLKDLPAPANLCGKWTSRDFFLFRKKTSIHREVTISIFHADPSLPAELHSQIGRAVVTLDPTVQKREYRVSLLNPSGPVGEVTISLRFHTIKESEIQSMEEKYLPIDPQDTAKRLKKTTGQKSIGSAKYAAGFRPFHPVLIIPGLASSALEALSTPEKEWRRERVWIDPFKIGRLAMIEKMTKVFGGGTDRAGGSSTPTPQISEDEGVGENINFGDGETAEKRRKWIEHMTLGPDGFSDPPNIKVRPVASLHGIDFLSTVSVARAQSYVFAHVIYALMEAGYDDTTLDACPYDWRLPPEKMDERDNFFGKMKKKIEGMVDHLGRPIVLLAHSMGNRVVQYFLNWIVARGEREWIDRYVYSFLAMGAPFLGASKSLRTVLCGDAMGLEVFLTKQEALYMARASASLPWLFPIQESLYPDNIMHVGSEKESGGGLSHMPVPFPTVLQSQIPRTQKFYEDFYLQNPHYLSASHLKKEKNDTTPPVLCPPPVKRIWVLNGINRQTEVGYYLKPKKAELDPSGDKVSGKKLAGVNPRGLTIQDGIAYEGADTYQPSIFACKSGDGTVPFCSLNYAEVAWSRDVHVYTVEVEDAEHREMLSNDACIGEILNLVCVRAGAK